MDYLLWFLASVVVVMVLTRKGSSMVKPDWYFVIKHTHGDYVGVVIDAYFVVDACDALFKGFSNNPIKAGEMLRGAWALNEKQRATAARLHEKRMLERREFELLMESINEA